MVKYLISCKPRSLVNRSFSLNYLIKLSFLSEGQTSSTKCDLSSSHATDLSSHLYTKTSSHATSLRHAPPPTRLILIHLAAETPQQARGLITSWATPRPKLLQSLSPWIFSPISKDNKILSLPNTQAGSFRVPAIGSVVIVSHDNIVTD